MKSRKEWILAFTAILLLGAASCDKPGGKTAEDTFDKKALLTNIGEHLILISYADLQKETDSLEQCQIAFAAAPTLSSLLAFQDQFLKTYLQYQTISVFELGPADAELYRANANTFPCDTAQILSKIANGDFAFSAAADIDAKGFPALDYLLFDLQKNNAQVLKRFTSNPNASNAVKYVNALVAEIAQKTRNIHNSWKPGGANYINTFSNNTGSNVGSSIGMLVNQFCFDLEILKNARIGIPAGKKSLGVLYPEKTEGYYSASSLALAKVHLQSLENLYLGKGKISGDGVGFDDYLKHINAKYGQDALHDIISAKFQLAKTKLDAIPETLAQSVSTNQAAVDADYNELQQLVVLLKVDMTSSLGIQITYQDNDGD